MYEQIVFVFFGVHSQAKYHLKIFLDSLVLQYRKMSEESDPTLSLEVYVYEMLLVLIFGLSGVFKLCSVLHLTPMKM